MSKKAKTFTKEELDQMSPSETINVFLKATKIEGVGVVRRSDGTVKYDKPENEGNFGEDDAV